MSKKRKNDFSKILSPLPERSLTFRGVRFYTKNLGAIDQMSGRFVWFAVGSWTHDQADGVFSDLVAAVADRFNIWEHLSLSIPGHRTPEQAEALAALEAELVPLEQGAA